MANTVERLNRHVTKMSHKCHMHVMVQNHHMHNKIHISQDLSCLYNIVKEYLFHTEFHFSPELLI